MHLEFGLPQRSPPGSARRGQNIAVTLCGYILSRKYLCLTSGFYGPAGDSLEGSLKAGNGLGPSHERPPGFLVGSHFSVPAEEQ